MENDEDKLKIIQEIDQKWKLFEEEYESLVKVKLTKNMEK